MEITDFIKKFAAQFDETDVADFKEETTFKELEEWSSLLALSIIAMVDEEYHIRIKGNDIREASTLKELFDIIVQKK